MGSNWKLGKLGEVVGVSRGEWVSVVPERVIGPPGSGRKSYAGPTITPSNSWRISVIAVVYRYSYADS